MSAPSSAIIVHGGAGTVADDRHPRLREGVRRAAAAGDAILVAGGTALDAVTTAVRVLEDDPEYNAGTGSALTREGTVETDASIMDGASQRVGAVAAVPDLGTAIALARAVLEAGEHVILAGPAAWKFAAEVGITPAPTGSLVTERMRTRLAAYLAGGVKETSGGTVGAVARDHHGNFAAATSTGGIVGKRVGRVGDSPIPGAGTWADSATAWSATGDGEAIVRTALTRTLSMIAPTMDLETAATEGLLELARVTGKTAGVIGVNKHGVVGVQLTPTMPIASIVRGESVEIADSMGKQVS